MQPWQKGVHMTDVELTRALERGEIANENFGHTSHLHVAWVYLSESSSPIQAAAKMRKTLRDFAAALGKLEKYHETITLFWIYFLARARVAGAGHSLEELVHANPRLLEKDFPLTYYSHGRLFSDRARNTWVEPDLKPFSLDAIAFCPSSPPSDPPNRPVS
jgi:hypothetical protein